MPKKNIWKLVEKFENESTVTKRVTNNPYAQSMVGVVEFIKNLNVDSMDDLIIFGVPVKNGSYVFGSALSFGICFNPSLIVHDGTYVIRYSIKAFYPNCLSIMCFFHLMQNVKKQTTKIQEESRKEIYKDVYKMRDTKSLQEFQSTETKILSKWQKKGFSDFAEYFSKQWICSEFKNWQLFLTRPGMEMSNSPIESYNRVIKDYFTNRVKFNMLPVIEIFVNVVKFESKSCKQPKEIPKLKQKDVSYSKVVLKSKKFEKVSNTNGLAVFKYRHKNNNIDYIEISDPECNCLEFQYLQLCQVFRYWDLSSFNSSFNLFKKKYPGLKLKDDEFVNKSNKKVGRYSLAKLCLTKDN
ncbi:Carbonic anhydrase 2 [Brachionus plicatilis]|uniref:Carbonic anhydrase 2 n=1 Tax=Brachionus plicatilis TaxID=10195 RepID=A0A3M7PLC0_BRAPC|nr:Carbonic anhydrase 2 [Brachionus plicatilis]